MLPFFVPGACVYVLGRQFGFQAFLVINLCYYSLRRMAKGNNAARSVAAAADAGFAVLF
jgi:hypothetical protein